MGYDTIYGVQDVTDDEIIGVKSTSIKFKKNIKLFVGSCYLITCSLIVALFYNDLGINLSSLFILMFILSLIYQLKIFNMKSPKKCLKAFKLNNYSGLLFFISILMP